MLSCKDFVQQSAELLNKEELSFMQNILNKIHLLFCHHCRNYLKQVETTVLVANKLKYEHANEQQIESSVTKMRTFSEINSTESE